MEGLTKPYPYKVTLLLLVTVSASGKGKQGIAVGLGEKRNTRMKSGEPTLHLGTAVGLARPLCVPEFYLPDL